MIACLFFTVLQVVIAMRDLFQVVFELKKKEIELTKQHLEQNAISVIKFHLGFVEPSPDTKVNYCNIH